MTRGDAAFDAVAAAVNQDLDSTAVKYPRWLKVHLDDGGNFIVQEVRDAMELTPEGTRQKIVQRSCTSRSEVVDYFQAWANQYSDVAVDGLRASLDPQRGKGSN